MEQEQKYYYHRIPKANELTSSTEQGSKKEAWFIGIIDSSGSMSSWWKHVAKNYNELVESLSTPKSKIITYCFDSGIHQVPDNKLSDNIHDHGGSMTNIYRAMMQLDKELEKIPFEDEVKVCFVSDGQDTCNSDVVNMLKKVKGSMGRKLTFMCVGVQSGFPTKVSMFLREKYHTGDGSVPSIFLIEYAGDKAFFNKFQTVKQFCSVKALLKISPAQRLFPWEHPVEEVSEDQWIMSQQKEITINGSHKVVYNDDNFSVEAVCDIFRGWSQKLQLESLNKKINFEQSKEYASSCYGLMQNIVADIQASRGLDIVSGKTSEKQDFLNQVLNLQIVRTSSRVNGYLTAVKEIQDGRDLGKLSEYEAAKIIGLGTVVGKAQQRALALKQMTATVLKEYIEEFIAEFEKLELQPDTGYKQSYRSNRSFKALLDDPSLVAGLRKFHSPLDFLDVFPLFGLAIDVKRSLGYDNDAWKVAVKGYNEKGLELDSSTFDFATHKIKDDSGVEYNALCPLIPKNDAYLAPLYNTRLMKYIISYNTTEQLDKINPDSWEVLLADLFVQAFNKDDFDTVQQVMDTFKAIKDTNELVKTSLEKIEMGDSTVYASLKSKNVFYALHYYFLTDHQEEEMDPEEIEEYIQKLWIYYFKERLSTESITAFIQTSEASNIKAQLLAKYTPEYTMAKFYTTKELVRYMKKEIIKEMNQIAAVGAKDTLTLVPGGFTSDVNNDVSYKFVKKLVRKLMNDDELSLSDDETFIYLAHSSKNRESSLEIPIDIDVENAKISLAAQFQKKSSREMKKKIAFQLTSKLKKIYLKQFKHTHWNTLPKKWEEVVEICKARGIDYTKIDWDHENGMARNACMCDDCPHQFVPMSKKKLRNHLGGWQGMVPRAFHMFVKSKTDLEPEAVYEQFLKLRGIKDISTYGVTKEKVLEYIENVQAKYQAI